MKRVLKRIAKACWRATGPARRPVARKYYASLRRPVSAALQEEVLAPVLPRLDETLARLDRTTERLGGLEAGLNCARLEWQVQGAEIGVSLDGLVREVTRLQMQVEDLQAALDRAQALTGGDLSIVADDGEAVA